MLFKKSVALFLCVVILFSLCSTTIINAIEITSKTPELGQDVCNQMLTDNDFIGVTVEDDYETVSDDTQIITDAVTQDIPNSNNSSDVAISIQQLATSVDYSHLTVNQYISKLILNHNYSGKANNFGVDEKTGVQMLYEGLYFDPAKVSGARIIFDEYKNANDVQTLAEVYGTLTFKPSNLSDTCMGMDDYYTAIILDVIGEKVQEDNFVNYLDCELNNVILTLSEETANYFDSSVENLGKFNIKELLPEEYDGFIKTLLDNGSTDNLYKRIGKNVNKLGIIIDGVTTIKDAIDNIAMYSVLADVDYALLEVLRVMSTCCGDNYTMKTAVDRIYDYASGSTSNALLSLIEAGEAAGEFAVGTCLDLWWNCTLNFILGPLSAGVLIGQALGGAIANFCFATDEKFEQLLVIGCMVDFENVMLATVGKVASNYYADESALNADAFIKSLHLLLSTYDTGHDYTLDFIKLVYQGGFINKLFKKNKEKLEWWESAVASRKNSIQWETLELQYYYDFVRDDAHDLLLRYWGIDVGEDYDDYVRPEVESIEFSDPYIEMNIGDKYTNFVSHKPGASHLFDVYFYSSDTSVVTVEAYGDIACDITAVGSGTATIYAQSPNGLITSCEIKVNPFAFTLKDDGTYEISDCVDYNGDVVIPKKCNGILVTSIGPFAFSGCTSLTGIEIPNSVTTIERYAFNECKSLKKLYIPASVITVDQFAFCGCSGLTEVNISDISAWCNVMFNGYEANPLYYAKKLYLNDELVTDIVVSGDVERIGSCAFYNYDLLETVSICDSVTSIGKRSFFSCDSLELVSLPDSISYIGEDAFRSCVSLSSMNIPEDVDFIGDGAFWDCYSLVGDVVLTGELKKIGSHTFYNCRMITSVTLPESVSNIYGYAFSGCASLESVTLPKNLEYWDIYVFYECISLKEITIPGGVERIGGYSFYNCLSLEKITMPSTLLEVGSNTFYGCSNLAKVEISDISNWCLLSFVDVYANPLYVGADLYVKGELVVDLIIPEYVTEIKRYAFYGCTAIKSVTFTNTVESIGYNAFNYCEYIENVYAPDLITWCGIDFYDATSNPMCYADNLYIAGDLLTTLIIPDEVEYIYSYAFAGCETIKNVEFHNGIKTVEAYAFRSCSNIKNLYIQNIESWCDIYFVNERSNPLYYAKNLYLNGELVQELVIPKTVTSISDYAFYGYKQFKTITLPDSVIKIGSKSFYGCSNLVIKAPYNSYVMEYANNKNIPYECSHLYTNYISDKNGTCVSYGTKTAYCDYMCGMSDTVINAEFDDEHCWSEWKVIIMPTLVDLGLEERVCELCGASESRNVPVLDKLPFPSICINNYDVVITNANYIKDLRYAPGEYTTTTEIRNAEGNVAISNSLVQKYTVDGNFVYEMPNGGYYTVWIRMQDGTNYILPLDVTNFTPTVTSNGVTVTLHDLYDVRDFYIAKGEYNSYREIKDNGFIFSATAAKIAGRHDYTHPVYEPGVHTVCIRYNDGSTVILHETLTVDEPVFTTNGLQVTVSNIPDVKVIRTAYGEYYSSGDVKRAEGSKNFSGKTVIKGADEYTLRYKQEGRVTIVVDYNNGYVKVFHYDVQKKTPTVEQEGNTVTFGNLDGLFIIRYAKGEYTTSSQIKAAKDSKVLKADSIVDCNISVTLDPGRYTFCVQYDDESYNYYTIDVE